MEVGAIISILYMWKIWNHRDCLMYSIFIIIILVLSEGEPTKP